MSSLPSGCLLPGTIARRKYKGVFPPKGAMIRWSFNKKNIGAISFETKFEQQISLIVSASFCAVNQWSKFHLLCLKP